jgi:ADP-heptose:LPS heptosyltransferase
VHRILVVRAGALGDTLMATPVLAALADRHPGAAIDVVASAPAAPLLAGHPHVARVLALGWRNLPRVVSPEKRALVRDLRAAAYDLAIVLERAPRYVDLVERARPRRLIGFQATAFDPALHSAANNLRAAGFEDWASRSLAPQIFLDENDEREAGEVLGGLGRAEARPHDEERRRLVGLHAGYGPPRRKKYQETRLRGWRLDRFAEVGRRLVARGFRIVLTGSTDDREAVARIARELPPGSAIDLAGKIGVRTLAAVIRRLDLLVSVDSGPAHIAAAVSTPLVVLWGPGILEQTRPIARDAPVVILRRPPPCAPCYGTPLMKTCPRNICMEAITPGEVVTTAVRLLKAEG